MKRNTLQHLIDLIKDIKWALFASDLEKTVTTKAFFRPQWYYRIFWTVIPLIIQIRKKLKL